MKFNYCVQCAAPLTKNTNTEYICSNDHLYWNNPRAAVSIVLIKNEQVLFAKRGIQPQKGKYDLPGGFVDYGENPFDAITREVNEETGLKLRSCDVLFATGQLYEENNTVCDIVFISKEWEGTPKASDDVASLEWQPVDFIDSSHFAWDYQGVTERIKEYLRRG